jgi:hypothetical protein
MKIAFKGTGFLGRPRNTAGSRQLAVRSSQKLEIGDQTSEVRKRHFCFLISKFEILSYALCAMLYAKGRRIIND